jgi:hypothetical protein
VREVERSRAYVRLAERFGEVRTLLDLCSSPETDPHKRRAAANADAAILRGALVLLCSHLEGFFEDLVSEALRAFDCLAPTVATIPLAIRKRQILYRLRGVVPPNSNPDWERLLECLTHPLLQDDHPCSPGARKIDSDLHVGGFASPGSSEVDGLMASIGVSECWVVVAERIGNRLGKATVDAVVNRRNQIAHGDLESSVSRSDVEEYVNTLELVCSEFDAVVGEHIAFCTGRSDPWTLLLAG